MSTYNDNSTVDGNLAPNEVGSLSHHLQGFIHPRWCRISFINSMTMYDHILTSKGCCFHPSKNLAT